MSLRNPRCIAKTLITSDRARLMADVSFIAAATYLTQLF